MKDEIVRGCCKCKQYFWLDLSVGVLWKKESESFVVVVVVVVVVV